MVDKMVDKILSDEVVLFLADVAIILLVINVLAMIVSVVM